MRCKPQGIRRLNYGFLYLKHIKRIWDCRKGKKKKKNINSPPWMIIWIYENIKKCEVRNEFDFEYLLINQLRERCGGHRRWFGYDQ